MIYDSKVLDPRKDVHNAACNFGGNRNHLTRHSLCMLQRKVAFLTGRSRNTVFKLIRDEKQYKRNNNIKSAILNDSAIQVIVPTVTKIILFAQKLGIHLQLPVAIGKFQQILFWTKQAAYVKVETGAMLGKQHKIS